MQKVPFIVELIMIRDNMLHMSNVFFYLDGNSSSSSKVLCSLTKTRTADITVKQS